MFVNLLFWSPLSEKEINETKWCSLFSYNFDQFFKSTIDLECWVFTFEFCV